MPSSRVAVLTREDITAAASTFHSPRQMPRWTVVVEGREFPARPLILHAAGVFPNDPTNSHQAVALLKAHGFEVRYQGRTVAPEEPRVAPTRSVDEIIRNLQALFKGPPSMLEMWEREHRIEKDRS
jgi:hypothetical protein